MTSLFAFTIKVCVITIVPEQVNKFITQTISYVFILRNLKFIFNFFCENKCSKLLWDCSHQLPYYLFYIKKLFDRMHLISSYIFLTTVQCWKRSMTYNILILPETHIGKPYQILVLLGQWNIANDVWITHKNSLTIKELLQIYIDRMEKIKFWFARCTEDAHYFPNSRENLCITKPYYEIMSNVNAWGKYKKQQKKRGQQELWWVLVFA